MESVFQLNNRSSFTGADQRSVPDNEHHRSSCCSSFCRSVQRLFCCQRYLPEPDRSELFVIGTTSSGREFQPWEELGLRTARLSAVVHEQLSSLGNPSGVARQEIWNIAICRVTNATSLDEITVQNIFGPGEVEQKRQAMLIRASEFESKVKTYDQLEQYKPKSSDELDSIKECSLSFDDPCQLICYQGGHFCNYEIFLHHCRYTTNWYSPWDIDKEVDLELVTRVEIPSKGMVNSAFEPDDALNTVAKDTA